MLPAGFPRDTPRLWLRASSFFSLPLNTKPLHRARLVALAALVCVALAVAPLAAQNAAPTWATLRDFSLADGAGASRTARLVEANGFIYGVRQWAGAFDEGTLFRAALDGTGFTVLHNFRRADGDLPTCVITAQDGKLYGATNGWTDVIFRINADGTGYSRIYEFTNYLNGWNPGDLIEGADRALYGVCLVGGHTNYDAAVGIFRLERDGTGFRMLRVLSRETEGAGVNGLPGVMVVQGPDGALYGSAPGAGRNDCGTLFRMNADGSGFTVLRQMTAADGRQPNRLVFAPDGKIYGTAFYGGSADLGTVFRMDRDGVNFTVLRNLQGSFQSPMESQRPWAGLTAGNDGLLYGVSSGGGSSLDVGTLYRIDPATGAYLLLRAMQPSDGAPVADLLAASNGRLYGMTSGGGLNRHGTLFSYTPANASRLLRATVGIPFTYATSTLLGVARSYFAEGLPLGLSIDSVTGNISGTPREAGAFTLNLSAPVPSNVGPIAVQLEVAAGVASVSIAGLAQTYDGRPKPVVVTTNPPGLAVATSYAGSSTPPIVPGSYAVVVRIADRNYVGTASATLTIGGTAPSISPWPAMPPVIAGTPLTLRAEVVGAEPITYRWQRRPSGTAIFIDLVEGEGFTGVTTAQLSFTSPTLAMEGDEFQVVATNALGSTTSPPLRLSVVPAAVLANVAIRAQITTDTPLTVGFVTRGERILLVRAIGPGLAPFTGNEGIARNPTLILSDLQQATLATNDDWGGASALISAFASAGAFPLPSNSEDAALITRVSGSATARMAVRGSGLGMTEVYDLGNDPAARIVNVSTLHHAGQGRDALVLGFTIAGTGTKRLLVRGIGPRLGLFGITSPLTDPQLIVYSASGAQLVSNDDWPQTLAVDFAKVGAFPLADGSKDAALSLNVPPGSYTVQLSSGAGRDGVGLIEIYELP